MKKKFYLLLAACCFKLLPAMGAAFTPGNIVVLRVGAGTAALSSAATAVFLDEYTTSGTLVQSIAIPNTAGSTTSGLLLTMSGSATSEGQISRSANGQYIAIGGYSATVGTAAIASSNTTNNQRTVAFVKYDGSVTVPFGFGTSFSGNNIRGVYSLDGVSAYAIGASTGVVYGNTSGATTIYSNSSGQRSLNVAELGGNAQLFFGASAGTNRYATVGTGLPTTAGQTVTNLPGTNNTTSNANQVFFADLNPTIAGVDVMYVADDVAGITKYSLVGGTWTATGTAGTAADVYRGLTGVVTTTGVTLYGISNLSASSSKLVTITDNSGYNGTLSGTPTVIASNNTNTIFRSVVLAPFNSAATPNTFVGNISANFGLDYNYSGGAGNGPTATTDANIIATGPANRAVVAGSNAVRNLSIGTGANLAVATPGTLSVAGTITNNGTFSNTGMVQLTGSTAQSIAAGTFSGNTINNLTVNNSAGITLNTPLTVNGTLTLTSGIITAGSNVLTIGSTAPGAISGGSSTAYVAGTIKRTHDAVAGDAYLYPIGSSTKYRPVRLTNGAGVTGTNAFSATYFPTAYSNTTATNASYHVSSIEYWDIARVGGTSAMNVSLITDNDANSGISDRSTVEVGHFNSGTNTWDNLGNNGGNAASGSGSNVSTTGVSNFSPFTFISNAGSPLPIGLNAFSLKEISNNATQLLWTIAQAANIATVTIERSEDGRSFQAIGSVSGDQVFNGNYTDAALPATGTLYYRLKMLNPAGEATYSNTLVAMHSTNGTLNVYPNPAGNTATISWHAGTLPVQITLTNAIGQQVYAVTPAIDVTNATINVAALPAGQYIITWKQGSVMQHSKLSVVR